MVERKVAYGNITLKKKVRKRPETRVICKKCNKEIQGLVRRLKEHKTCKPTSLEAKQNEQEIKTVSNILLPSASSSDVGRK